MRSKIMCCKGCEKPKRYPGCHDHCDEYKTERLKLDEENLESHKERMTQAQLNSREWTRIGIAKGRIRKS